MRFNRKRFEAEAKAAGLEATHKGNGHWQLTGGSLLVNFYPYAKRGPKIYVQGTNEGRHGTAEEAIAAANKRPDVCPRADRDKRRRFGYRAKRRRMLRKSNRCHWCQVELTLDTSTLDHEIPLARGGLDNANNWVLACDPCNDRRAAKMPELAGIGPVKSGRVAPGCPLQSAPTSNEPLTNRKGVIADGKEEEKNPEGEGSQEEGVTKKKKK